MLLTSALFTSFFALSMVRFESAWAQIDYAVYYEPSKGLPNPLGPGFDPESPSNWCRADEGTRPIFLDWGKVLKDPSAWYTRGNKGNECEDRSKSSYNDYHQQSPIMLQKKQVCDDRHKVTALDKGKCEQNSARFYSTPYGLGVDLTKCSGPLKVDSSLNEDPWFLQEIVIKTPAEHSTWDESKNTEKKFVGELQLAFKGSNKGFDPNVSHEGQLAIVGVLLELGTSGQYDSELEKLIKGWEAYQAQRYTSCGVTYDYSTCKLQKSRASVRRELNQPASGESALVRNLVSSAWHKTCSGSYYCFANLYTHTETEFYYKYRGGLTYPPCTENVHWYVMQKPLKISPDQLQRIERLIYKHLDNKKCQLGTVGKKRGSSTCPCCVDTNRPRQALSRGHRLNKCDEWASTIAAVGDDTSSSDTVDGTTGGRYICDAHGGSKGSTSEGGNSGKSSKSKGGNSGKSSKAKGDNSGKSSKGGRKGSKSKGEAEKKGKAKKTAVKTTKNLLFFGKK